MKKFVTAVAVVALVAFAAPVFAATNPFMDVPMNHWAYDAIGQLAAHGILSGYPDGLYKGKQPTTRYEMASALARALAVVDMTKASKQDVEMLQKLVVEFHDELEALGVRVDDIEGKVNLLDSRLGGWKLSGILRMDVGNESEPADPTSVTAGTTPQTAKGFANVSRARIQFDRWFGDSENPMHFRAILQGDSGEGNDSGKNWKHFFVEIPFFYDTLLTVGRVNHNWESAYYYDPAQSIGGFIGLGAMITDTDIDKVQIDKQFGMGTVSAYVAHRSALPVNRSYVIDANGAWREKSGLNPAGTTGNMVGSAWEFALRGSFQFNEQFGFDLGFQGFKGDEAEPFTPTTYVAGTSTASLKFNDMYTIFAGLRFNFNDNVAFKGVYYYQKLEVDDYMPAPLGWHDALDLDKANRWSVMLDVKQEALKFTSLWLEYGQVDKGFMVPNGNKVNDGRIFATTHLPRHLNYDMKFYRIGLTQDWNEKWATHEFYYGYKLDDTPNTQDDMSEWGLGVVYKYNPNVSFGLNFVQADNGLQNNDKDNIVKFRTQVTF